MTETRADAEQAFDAFINAYNDKYPKAANCLAKDRAELLMFYDFTGAHWQSIRTTNPIESTFATVRLRTAKTRGCVSRNEQEYDPEPDLQARAVGGQTLAPAARL